MLFFGNDCEKETKSLLLRYHFKTLELMKISELVRIISRAGCYLLKHKTRHDLWINPATNETFLIPRHQSEEVPKGLEKAALKWAQQK